MRNTIEQLDPNTPEVWTQVPGRTIIVAGDIASGDLLIDPADPPATNFQRLLHPRTSHISWSLEGGEAYVTFDGTDPADPGTDVKSRHILIAANLGTIWGEDLVRQARLAIKSAAPVFIYSEMQTK